MAVIIDASHLLMRNIHMNKHDILNTGNIVSNSYYAQHEQEQGGMSYLAHLLLNGYLSVINKFGCSRKNPLILAIDARPSWRKKYFEENSKQFKEYIGEGYKSNREKDETIPWDEIYNTFNEVNEALSLYSDVIVMTVEEAEGDDIVAVVAKEFSKTEDVYIVSSDKDFKQLINDRIKIYDPLKKLFVPNINTDFYLKKHILIGDASDNIKPVMPRMGEKTAEKKIKDLDIFLQINPDVKDRYYFNKKLIDFNEIPEHIQKNILKLLNQNHYNYNMINLSKMFQKYKLRTLLEKIRYFKFEDKKIESKLIEKYKEINEIKVCSLEDI